MPRRLQAPAAAARKHALKVERHKLDQAEHALDQQLRGCQ
jgi:hypothetical protein